MTDLRIIAEVRDYGSLLEGLRVRVKGLGVAFEKVDEAGFMADGQASKLLAPHPTRMMGPSTFAAMLAATGSKLLLVEDAEAMAKIADLLTKRTREARYAGNGMLARRKARLFALLPFRASPAFAKMVRAQQLLQQSAKQRREIASAGGKARWAKRRREKALAE